MDLISAEGYKHTGVRFLRIRKTGELWVSMKDVGDGLGLKNISALVVKEIQGTYEKELTKEENKCFKMAEREIFKKFDNLNKDELNTKSNKNIYAKNNIMTNIIKYCKGEKKRNKSNRWI